jgi:uncharacterized repeat protein (TIGR01451 family)
MRCLLARRKRGLVAALLALVFFATAAPVQAACTAGACVSAGPRLASVDNKRGALLNAVTGALGNSAVNLSVSDWNTVAGGNVDLVRTLNVLQTTMNVSSNQAVLNGTATVSDFLAAAASAATQENKSGLALQLNKLSTQLVGATTPIAIGSLITTSGVVGTTSVNALDLVTGAVQLYNKDNVATTGQTPITVSGVDLGLASVASVKVLAQAIEPPVFVCGGTGTTFHSAAVRVHIDMDLVDVNLDLSAIALPISAKVGDLSLYVEVAQADGAIGTINAITNAMSVTVTPGIAKLFLGYIVPATFFNRTRPLVAGDVTWGNIGLVTLAGVPLGLQAKASAFGTNSAQRTLNFSAAGGYPQTQTAVSSTTSITTLLSTLATNLQVQTPGLNAGVLTGTVNALLSSLVGTLFNVTLLPSLLADVVDPLLGQLGVHVGEVDVNAGGRYLLCPITGCVYDDANHNLRLDTTEAGATGTTLYAKLLDTRTPNADALAAVAVNSTTGMYSLPGYGSGNFYRVVINGNASLSNKTPAAPAGWVPTEMPTLTRDVTILGIDVPLQNFGLYHGSKLSGTVFKDNGVGSGGIANNGTRDGTEAAIVASTVKATDAAGTLTYDTTTSGDNGAYSLWLPFATNGASLKVTQNTPGDWTSVSGNAGTTGGAYVRTTDTTTFTHASGSSYTGVNFGDVPANLFINDGQQTIQPGHVAFYAHSFTAGSAGSMTLALSGPVLVGWNATAYVDVNCNGAIDPTDTLISAAIPVVADQKVCIVVRVFSPVTAPLNTQYPLALTATMAYSTAGFSVNHGRTDLTLIGTATDSGLKLTKVVDKASALPGEVLTYTITYLNQSDKGLTTMKVMDATPAYTVFATATCGAVPNVSISCNASTKPTVGFAGRIEWTFTGTLTPGATGTVLFTVTVQ